jgi:hypothetical protein
MSVFNHVAIIGDNYAMNTRRHRALFVCHNFTDIESVYRDASYGEAR